MNSLQGIVNTALHGAHHLLFSCMKVRFVLLFLQICALWKIVISLQNGHYLMPSVCYMCTSY